MQRTSYWEFMRHGTETVAPKDTISPDTKQHVTGDVGGVLFGVPVTLISAGDQGFSQNAQVSKSLDAPSKTPSTYEDNTP